MMRVLISICILASHGMMNDPISGEKIAAKSEVK